MDLQSDLIKCPACKGRQEPREFLSAAGDRTVKTCKSCRTRILGWKADNPKRVHESIVRTAPQARARAKAWCANNTERAQRSAAKWRAENLTPERNRAYQAKWLAKPGNKAKARSWVATWMKANPEKMQAYYKRWYVENQDVLRKLVSERSRVYRASKFTLEDWLTILEVFAHRCGYCLRDDVKLSMDHMIPISKGGEHTVDNIVPACKSCNSKKNDRPIFLMVGKAA